MSGQRAAKIKRSWILWTLLGVALAALAGIGISAVLFTSWSRVSTVSSQDAQQRFVRATREAGGGPAYLNISPEGSVTVRRQLERESPVALSTLHLLAWGPGQAKLLEIDFPFWFVRVKMSDSINLGTLTSVLVGDWSNLNLKVSVEELERLGPGLVLDHRLADGRRILLWTEAHSDG